MSASLGPNSKYRRKLDQYGTPRWAVEAIMKRAALWLPLGSTIVDAGTGTGVLLEVALDHFPLSAAFGIEIDESLASGFMDRFRSHEPHPDLVLCDFLSEPSLRKLQAVEPTLVIANPPFKQAMEFVLRAIEIAKPAGGCVAFLLRLNWLASMGRSAFMRATTPDVYVLPRRPSFTGDGKTDGAEYAWFVFFNGRGEGRWEILDVAPAREA